VQEKSYIIPIAYLKLYRIPPAKKNEDYFLILAPLRGGSKLGRKNKPPNFGLTPKFVRTDFI